MTAPTGFPEEECFNVYWKIKNFSYCCGKVRSPEFVFTGNYYYIELTMDSVNVSCSLQNASHYRLGSHVKMEISFLSCDGLPQESISDEGRVNLQVPKDAIFGSRRNAFLPNDTLTIRFRSLSTDERVKHFICSAILVKRKYFLWTFENISNSLHDPKRYNRYEMSKPIEKSECYGEITLTLKPTGGINIEKNFSIEIFRGGGEWCYCILKVFLLGADGEAFNCIHDEFVWEKTDSAQVRVFPSLIQKRKLFAHTTQLLPNDTLSLKCEFAISLGTVTDLTADSSYSENLTLFLKESVDVKEESKGDSISIADLNADLKSMLEDGTLNDVVLHVGPEVIRVHKNILSARSPVFKVMFTKDMKESTNNTVVIEDLCVDTVRGLLLYMYTDTIHAYEWESMKNLYLAADKYEVLSLKDKCVSFLKINLSVSNVSEALFLADLQQDADLKTSAIDFISRYDSAVFASEAWKKLENNNYSLALKFLREICCTKQMRLN